MRKIFLVSVICLFSTGVSATLAFADDELVGESEESIEVVEPAEPASESSSDVEEAPVQAEAEIPSDASEVPAVDEPPVVVDEPVSADASLPAEAPERTPLIKADSPLGKLAYLLNGDPNVATAPPYGFGFSPAGVHWGAADNDYFQITSFKITPLEAGEDVAGAVVGIGGIF